MLAEHGTIERQPLLEGRSMYIVMAPLEKRQEKKGEDIHAETIGDAVAAKTQQQPPEPQATAEQGTN
jgi:hypothetical protein